ncbi:hypothetical protein ACJMK2_025377 [Sinanodonta woodiana]|uniref:Uncharacterized protein n=1 Tax=Sinanodonta woodiana TaxID=1069815 RepID=A0ABD3XGA1_SINWO
MLLVLMLIFMAITLSITVAIIIFCRKKNSVFILQKSEHDSDVEMDDMITEIEISDEDSDNGKKCKMRRKCMKKISMTSAKSEECLINAQQISSGGYISIETSSQSSTPLLNNTHRDFQLITEGEKSFKLTRASMLPKSKSFTSIHESHKLLLNVPKSGQYNETSFGSQQENDLKVETIEKKEKEYIQQIQSQAITDFKFRYQQKHGQSKRPLKEKRSLPPEETDFLTKTDKLSQDDEDIYHFDGRLQIM